MLSSADNMFKCLGCDAEFKHNSSLSLHKNGNLRKKVSPCKKYMILIGKEVTESGQPPEGVTKERFDYAVELFERFAALNEEKATTHTGGVTIKGFGKDYPPPHITLEDIRTRFMTKRKDEFIASLFGAFHNHPVGDGVQYLSVRIPKADHDSDVEYFDGMFWKKAKIYTLIDDFISALNQHVMDKIMEMIDEETEEGHDFCERYTLFTDWCPDHSDDLVKMMKRYEDEAGNKHVAKYPNLIRLIKAVLLNEKRYEISQIQKQHKKNLKN